MTATILLATPECLDRIEGEGGLRVGFMCRYRGTLHDTADPTPQRDGAGFDDLLATTRLLGLDEALIRPVDALRQDRIELEQLRKNFLQKLVARRHVWLRVISGDADDQIGSLKALGQSLAEACSAYGVERGPSAVILVFTTPIADEARALVSALLEHDGASTRVYIMGESLQPAADAGRLVASAFVWPMAVARLLVVLSHRGVQGQDQLEERPGLFAWRTILWGGTGSDEVVRRYHALLREKVLPGDVTGREVFDVPSHPDSDEELGGRSSGDKPETGSKLVEFKWEHDPDDVAEKSRKPMEDRNFEEILRESGDGSNRERASSLGIQNDDLVNRRAEDDWLRIRKGGPSALRSLREGRHWVRHDVGKLQKRQAQEWEATIEQRRDLDKQREHHRDAAEEVAVARARHLSLGWRLLLAAVVMIFVGQIIASILLPLRPPLDLSLIGASNSFMGIPLEGKSIGFLVDRSGSMEGERIERLRSEIERSVTKLVDGTPFCIVAYSSEHEVMPGGSTGLVAKDGKMAEGVIRWIQKLPAEGDTKPVGGLRALIAMKPETVVFLTDGQFAAEDKQTIDALIAEFKSTQPSARVHSIALFQQSEEEFLKQIAEKTGGSYRHVRWDPFAPLGFELVATIILAMTALGAATGAVLPWALERWRGTRAVATLRGSTAGLLSSFASIAQDLKLLRKRSEVVRCRELENHRGAQQRSLAGRSFGLFKSLLSGGDGLTVRRSDVAGGSNLRLEDRSDYRRELDISFASMPIADRSLSDDELQPSIEADAKRIAEVWMSYCERCDIARQGMLPLWEMENSIGSEIRALEEGAEMAVSLQRISNALRVPDLEATMQRELGDRCADRRLPFLSMRTSIRDGLRPIPQSFCYHQIPENPAVVRQFTEAMAGVVEQRLKCRPSISTSNLGVSAIGLVHQELAISLDEAVGIGTPHRSKSDGGAR